MGRRVGEGWGYPGGVPAVGKASILGIRCIVQFKKSKLFGKGMG
jgi:hypothetical protein